jgi:hypothetical protein
MTNSAVMGVARSAADRWERTVLNPDPADQHVDQVAVDPDPHHHPGPVRAHPELPLAQSQGIGACRGRRKD